MGARTAEGQVFLLKTSNGLGKIIQMPSSRYAAWQVDAEFCTSKEAARFLDVTVPTVISYCRRGILRGHLAPLHEGSRYRAWNISRGDVQAHFLKHSAEESWLFTFEDPERDVRIDGVERMALPMLIQTLEWMIGDDDLRLLEYSVGENPELK